MEDYYCTDCESYVSSIYDKEYEDYVCERCGCPDLIQSKDADEYWDDLKWNASEDDWED